jgi:hypothetical protein
MMITKVALPRRTFLRGLGATMALPLLDAMVPALSALTTTAARPACRLGFIYVPNGIIQNQWVPSTVGPNFELSPILGALAPVRDHLLVLSGLAHRQADSFGDGNGDHARGTATWLSGVHPKRTEGPGIQAGITVDQIAAKELGRFTRLPSLELALEAQERSLGSCDNGYACVYINTISWRTPTSPVPMEIHPRMVFERLFGDGGSVDQRLAQIRKTHSILDSVNEEAVRLKQTLGATDRTKVNEYLDSVRDVEQRIQRAENQSGELSVELPDRPADIPEGFEDHAKLMFDLQVLAYQADITRVTTMLMAREQSGRAFPQIGVPEPHHSISHHRNDPVFIAKKAKIDAYHVQMLGYLLEKLKATPDGDGSLLDHSMILYGSGMGDGNLHEHTNLPALVAGGGAGKLKTGRHINYPEDTPKANLLVSMLDKAGIQTDKLGDSTGKLESLSGV